MSNINDILMSMDESLFDENQPAPSNGKGLSEKFETDPIHQEPLSRDMAKALLGSKYDPSKSVSYQLVTMRDATLVTKIDFSLNPDEDLTLPDGTTRSYITEYPLDDMNDVETLAELKHKMAIPPVEKVDLNIYRDVFEVKKSRWWIPILIIFLLLLGTGCALLNFLI